MELIDAIEHVVPISVMGQKVELDPQLFQFDESSISQFMEEAASWYAYFGSKLAEAEFERQGREIELDVFFAKTFTEFKEQGGHSDKLSEQKAKAEPKYEELRMKANAARRNERLLQTYMRAWDKAHENAQNRGHSLRKELDKLGGSSRPDHSPELSDEDKKMIADIVGEVEKKQEESES